MKQYIAIDLKSFYASVECVERGLDPLTTNLVVADVSKTEKTICLAVSPSLKMYGIPGRARLFEVVQKVEEINKLRLGRSPGCRFKGSSADSIELLNRPSLSLDYIAAKPQMSHYMRCSTKIYGIYLRYIAPEDIHVYSIDEVFIDATNYLQTYKMTAHELAMTLIREVLSETGITATAGIGTNMYLCKVAMDIVAKHIPADRDGVRIAELDEMTYRKTLWQHTPITDFWRVGKGIADKLAKNQIFTMGDVARCSVEDEERLYRLFGINAELLIDHAWGYEPCTIANIKAYTPERKSLSQGQVLSTPYEYDKARLIIREMTELLVLSLVDSGLVCDRVVLTIGYDIDNIKNGYKGDIVVDHYGRKIPKQAHGTERIGRFTSSTRLIVETVMRLFDRIADPELLVRRMYVVADNTVDKNTVQAMPVQLDLFSYDEDEQKKRDEEEEKLKREYELQKAVLRLQKRYGKNSVLKGLNLKEGATTIERNGTIGGHKA